MMARLDRMEGEREVAQFAATLGREFSHEKLTWWWIPRPRALRDALWCQP
jgi:predicted ATPase